MSSIDWYDDLFVEIRRLQAQYPSPQQFVSYINFKSLLTPQGIELAPGVLAAFEKYFSDVYALEDYCEPPSNIRRHTFEGAQQRDRLMELRHRLQDPPEKLRLLKFRLIRSVPEIAPLLPDYVSTQRTGRTYRFLDCVEVPLVIKDLIKVLLIDEGVNHFPNLGAKVEENCNNPGLPKRITDFDGLPEQAIKAYLKNTPLFDLFYMKVPFPYPTAVYEDQNEQPYDPHHPKHFCYQCHKPLPPDFAEQPWQWVSYPRGPFFHTEHCKKTAIKRHDMHTQWIEDDYKSLVKEYETVVAKYEHTRQQKQEEEMTKEQIRLQRDRESREERDRERAKREQDQFDRLYIRAHEEHETLLEKERKSKESEEARKAEADRWKPRLFKP